MPQQKEDAVLPLQLQPSPSLVTPTSYRGGYLLFLLSSQHNSLSKYLQIQSIDATTTHLVLTLLHLPTLKACLIVLDLIPPSHLSAPSYLEIRRFLHLLCKGFKPKLPSTLVFYPSSSASPLIQFITPPLQTTASTALMVSCRSGVVHFYSFLIEDWEWKAIGSFHLFNGSCTGLNSKTMEWISFHSPTVTLTWLERDEQERSSSVRCCPLPAPFCASLGVDIKLSSPQPYNPDTLVTTLYRWPSLTSHDFLVLTPAPSAAVAHWLFSTQNPETPQPLRSDFSRSPSERLLQQTDSLLTVLVIDYSVTTFSRASISLPVLEEPYTLSKIICTPLPHASSAASLASCLLVIQLETNSTKQAMCFLYLLDYSLARSILCSDSWPLTDTPHGTRLSSCHVIKSDTILLVHQPISKSQGPIISHMPLTTLLMSVRQSTAMAQWSRYQIQSPLHGEVVGLIYPKQDTEWSLQVKDFFHQPLVQVCLYTSCGELLEANRTLLSPLREVLTTAAPLYPPLSPSLASLASLPSSLRDISHKLFLANKLLNPTASPLSDLLKDQLYVPHAWYGPLSNPQSVTPSPDTVPERNFKNSVFLASESVAILPPLSTLRELWNGRNSIQLSKFLLPCLSPLPDSSASLPSSPTVTIAATVTEADPPTLVADLLYTIFTSDVEFLRARRSLGGKGHFRNVSLLANFFIDPSQCLANESADPPDSFSVRYLDLQDLFISCEEHLDLTDDPATRERDWPFPEEYLELSLWFLFKYSAGSLASFVYEILRSLSMRRSAVSQGGEEDRLYDSLRKLNKHQRQVLVRCLSFLESSLPPPSLEPEDTAETATAPLLQPEQKLYLTLCSFGNDSVQRIARCLCEWNRRDLLLQFVCPIFVEYNTPRVRLCLGDRWNRCLSDINSVNLSLSSNEDDCCMRWINPLDEDPMTVTSVSGEVAAPGDDDWGNTWKDASGSDSDLPPEDEVHDALVLNDNDCQSLAGETTCGTVTGGLIWDDVESDDEEESDQICWKHFSQDSRVIFLSSLKSCLLARDITSACALIACRPVEVCRQDVAGGADREADREAAGKGEGDNEPQRGAITDLDIILLFEDIYEEQMAKVTLSESQSQSGEDQDKDKDKEEGARRPLTANDLRRCIEAFPCR
jgi:hypothetical protein